MRASLLWQVQVYDLWHKGPAGIVPSNDGFTISNASIVSLPEKVLIMRFRRAFDATFNLGH